MSHPLLRARDELITLLTAQGLDCTGSGAGFGAQGASFETPDARTVHVDLLAPDDFTVHIVLPDPEEDDPRLLAHGTFASAQAAATFVQERLRDPLPADPGATGP